MKKLNSFSRRIFGPGKTVFRSAIKALLLVLILITLVLVSSDFLKPFFDLLSRYNLALSIGLLKVSLASIVKAFLIVILLSWMIRLSVKFCDDRIFKLKRVKEENKIIYSRVIQFLIYSISIIFALENIGVNVKSLTWFSGAFGIGIGFGLQRTAANLISGTILLFEKNLRNRDIVELADGSLGHLRGTGMRCTRMETFDGKEILIPNEELIISKVKHWTFNYPQIRLELKIPVAIDADLEQAHNIIVEILHNNLHVLNQPAPTCLLNGFNSNSAIFLLFFWLPDTTAYWSSQHEILFEIWRQFREHSIAIPHEQVDVFVK